MKSVFQNLADRYVDGRDRLINSVATRFNSLQTGSKLRWGVTAGISVGLTFALGHEIKDALTNIGMPILGTLAAIPLIGLGTAVGLVTHAAASELDRRETAGRCSAEPCCKKPASAPTAE